MIRCNLTAVVSGLLIFSVAILILSFGIGIGVKLEEEGTHTRCSNGTLLKFEGDPTVYGCSNLIIPMGTVQQETLRRF